MPISPAARSIISWALRSHPCSGANCPARARPAGCSRWRCGSSATANSKSKNSSRANTGHWLRRWPRRGARNSRPGSSAPMARKSSALTSAPPARPKPSDKVWSAPVSPSPAWRPSRRGATRPLPSPPRPCSKKRAASWALRPRTRCASRNGYTRASTSMARPSASSLTCAPMAWMLQKRRSPPLGG